HGLPVGVHDRRRLGLHVLCWVPVCRHAVATTPEGPLGRCRFTGVASPRPSDGGLPRYVGGSAPSSFLSGPTQRSLALRPACSPDRLSGPLSRRLRRFRYLGRRSDSFRLERLSSPGGTRTHWNNPHLFTSRNIRALHIRVDFRRMMVALSVVV